MSRTVKTKLLQGLRAVASVYRQPGRRASRMERRHGALLYYATHR